jgi:hypothetical protein
MRSPIVVGSSAGKVRRAKTRTLPVAPQAPAGKAGVRPAKSGHTDKIELPAWLDEAPRLELPAWLDEPQPEPAAAPASAPPPAAPARKPAGKKPKRKGAGKAGGKKQKRRP